jgi:hypothetical protein
VPGFGRNHNVAAARKGFWPGPSGAIEVLVPFISERGWTKVQKSWSEVGLGGHNKNRLPLVVGPVVDLE